MPRPPIARTCGKCTWVSTNPGSTRPSRRSTTSSSGCSRQAPSAGPRAAITPSRDEQRGVLLGAQVAAREGALRGVEEGAAEERHRRSGGAALSRSKAASSAAATATAMAAGSLLVVTPGQADGRVDPVDDVLGVPVAEQPGRGTAPTWPTSRSARSDRGGRAAARRRRGRRPRRGRGSSPARGCPAAARRAPARAAPARGGRAPRRRRRPAGASASASRCSARESTRCRSRSWRARMRASSRPTWPTPKIATDGTTGSGSSSTVTSPPQHCTPCCDRGLVGEVAVERLGAGAAGCEQRPRAAYGLGLEVAAADRAPGHARAATTILAPASRGAWPRTSVTVTRTPASRAARSVGHGLPPRGHTADSRDRARSSAQ